MGPVTMGFLDPLSTVGDSLNKLSPTPLQKGPRRIPIPAHPQNLPRLPSMVVAPHLPRPSYAPPDVCYRKHPRHHIMCGSNPETVWIPECIVEVQHVILTRAGNRVRPNLVARPRPLWPGTAGEEGAWQGCPNRPLAVATTQLTLPRLPVHPLPRPPSTKLTPPALLQRTLKTTALATMGVAIKWMTPPRGFILSKMAKMARIMATMARIR